jgi:hypothetical protein
VYAPLQEIPSLAVYTNMDVFADINAGFALWSKAAGLGLPANHEQRNVLRNRSARVSLVLHQTRFNSIFTALAVANSHQMQPASQPRLQWDET